jgi:hypothetical protein
MPQWLPYKKLINVFEKQHTRMGLPKIRAILPDFLQTAIGGKFIFLAKILNINPSNNRLKTSAYEGVLDCFKLPLSSPKTCPMS